MPLDLTAEQPNMLPADVETAKLQARTLALNEALILGALRQHEKTEAAEKSKTELAERVKERTAELSAANSLLHLEIAERKQAELKLIEASRIADEANNAKSAFLARMSHEIRTPLNGIIGLTYLLQQTELTGKQRDYASKVDYSAQNLLGIINDILDFSKIDAGKIELEKIEFNLGELLSRLDDSLTVLSQRKGLKFKVSIAPGTPLLLVGDPLRLGQVLTNLLSNAIKFTESGEVEIAVAPLECCAPDSSVQLEFKVRDTGMGMDAQQLSRLFQPFSQSDTSTARRFGGTGLGLVIAERFVQLMGGQLTVVSATAEGSTFSFNMSFQVRSEKAVQAVEIVKPETVPAHCGGRILLVDDDEINQLLAAEILQLAGYDVAVAPGGREALALLDQHAAVLPFAAVLMDLRMPGLDGYETTSLIRQDTRFDQLPIIAMTGDVVAGVRERCLDAGMDDYLTKPIHMAEFYAKLKKWVELPHGALPVRRG